MCLLTNERYKTYQTGFSFGRLYHARGVGLVGTMGGGGGGGVDGSIPPPPEIQPELVCELFTCKAHAMGVIFF